MASLTAEQRRELASKAALERWAKVADMDDPIKAICGSEEAPLVLADIAVPCYVLEGERRVITISGMQLALGLAEGGGATRLAQFVGKIALNPATANELSVRLELPIRFQPPKGGKAAFGYDADLLADICDALLEARRSGSLTPRYQPYAARAEILMAAWARVGLKAMIDEVTGFQYVRKRDALAELCARYISDKLMKWTKTFPDDFYTGIFRLKGWDYTMLKPGDRKPSCIGRYTRNIVYERMPAPVILKLEHLNPTTQPGLRAHKHHQYLTADVGHPELRLHLEKVIMLMGLSDDWDDFRAKLRKVMPKKWEQLELADLFPDPPDEKSPASDDGLD